MMKADDIRELSDDEIRIRLREIQEERFRLKFSSATMQLENPKLLNALRRDVARIKTILHERALAANSDQGTESSQEQDLNDG